MDGHDQRRQNMQNLSAQKAEEQGFSPVAARRRAALLWELDQLLTDKLYVVPDGLARAGYPDGTEYRIYDGSLPNSELAVLVKRVRSLPTWRQDEPTPDTYFRHGWGPGPHGLVP